MMGRFLLVPAKRATHKTYENAKTPLQRTSFTERRCAVDSGRYFDVLRPFPSIDISDNVGPYRELQGPPQCGPSTQCLRLKETSTIQ